MAKTKPTAQQKSSHWPNLLKNVVLSSIGTLSTNQPATALRAIA
jgi:hypothetical protein